MYAQTSSSHKACSHAGYGGDLTPNPDCIALNLVITLQTVASLLLDYSILGLVYARFSSPTQRANSIKFSKSLYMALDGNHLVLSARVTNVRRQTVLDPHVRLLLALEMAPDAASDRGTPLCLMVRCCAQFVSLTCSCSCCQATATSAWCTAVACLHHCVRDSGCALVQDLEANMSHESHARLALGLPANVCHVVNDDSPLHDLSVEMMAERQMEVRPWPADQWTCPTRLPVCPSGTLAA